LTALIAHAATLNYLHETTTYISKKGRRKKGRERGVRVDENTEETP
jgi:hypothetical protein